MNFLKVKKRIELAKKSPSKSYKKDVEKRFKPRHEGAERKL